LVLLQKKGRGLTHEKCGFESSAAQRL